MFVGMNSEANDQSERPCPLYQRRWRHLCVDKGLRDEWLETINSLVVWEVTYTCEGHPSFLPEPEPDSFPEIHLKVRSAIESQLCSNWSKMEAHLLSRFSLLFPESNYASHIACSPRIDNGELSCFIHLESRNRRRSEEMDEATRAWFDRTTRALVEFDQDTVESLNRLS
jgi:hypothetical protein